MSQEGTSGADAMSTNFSRITLHASRFTQRCKPLLVVVGPTAVGKSRLAIALARALGTEILTADSRQVYRGMDIGTDKPGPAERQGIPHRLIDLVDPDQPFNVGLYRRYALAEIDRLHRDGQVPLVVGGTGLYVRALLRGLWSGPSADWLYRARLEEEAAHRGLEYLHRELVRVDPESAGRLHPRDKAKIIRALEVYHLLGRPLSEAHRRHAFAETAFSACVIGLTRERSELYRRIEARVEEELAKGLVDETRHLLEKGYGRALGSMKGLGYRQIAGYLAGDDDYDEAVRRLKRDTRRYAKRQLTWFRQEPGIIWLTIEEDESPEPVVARILDQVERFLSQLDMHLEADTRTGHKLTG
ncbi:MAG: tRNA (adenosine(37)-N6)-dimethylallyltransferase MiaA [Nitrospiraceae bacterium]